MCSEKVGRERVVLVGIGGYGRRHLDYLTSGNGRNAFDLRAVVDPLAGRYPESEKIARDRGLALFPTVDEFQRTSIDVDLAVLSIPIPYHESLAGRFLDDGIDVLMEKPPVAVPSQLVRLREKSVAGNRICQIGFHWPPSRFFQSFKKMLLDGVVGRIRAVHGYGLFPRPRSYYQRSRWAGRLALDGEPVFDSPANNALAHLVHILGWLAGPDMDSTAEPSRIGSELYRSKPIESYDTCLIRGDLKGGMSYAFAATHSCPDPVPPEVPVIRISVEGTGGCVRAETGDGGFVLFNTSDSARVLARGDATIEGPYEDRVRFVRSGRERLPLTLGMTEAFTWTIAAAHSSGRIDTIAPRFIRETGSRADPLLELENAVGVLPQAVENGCSLREAGAPWATETAEPSVPVDRERLLSTEAEVLRRLLENAE